MILSASVLKVAASFRYGEKYTMTEIAEKTDITYSHVLKILQQLEKRKLIKTSFEGRKRWCYLTLKGLAFSSTASTLMEMWYGKDKKKE